MKRRTFLAGASAVLGGFFIKQQRARAEFDERYSYPEDEPYLTVTGAYPTKRVYTVDEQVHVQLSIYNHGGVDGELQRQIALFGPYNRETEIIEGEFLVEETVERIVPAKTGVDVSVALTTPNYPGTFIVDAGPTGTGHFIQDGTYTVEILPRWAENRR